MDMVCIPGSRGMFTEESIRMISEMVTGRCIELTGLIIRGNGRRGYSMERDK